MKAILLTKTQLGRKYPFSVSPVFIEKDNKGALYVLHKKRRYNLNGVATKGSSLNLIWLDNKDLAGTKISLSAVFDFCMGKGLL